MNFGKTPCSVTILRLKYTEHGKILKTLIITPEGQIDDFAKTFKNWSRGLYDKVETLHGVYTLKEKAENLLKINEREKNGFIVLTTLSSFMSDDFIKAVKKVGFECVVIDEFHKVKAQIMPRSQKQPVLSKNVLTSIHNLPTDQKGNVVYDFSYSKIKFAMGLSATPIANNYMDIFMPSVIIGNGHIFGCDFYKFRKKYFTEKRINTRGRSGGFSKYSITTLNRLNIQDKLKKYCFFANDKLDIKQKEVVKKIRISQDQAMHYERLSKTMASNITSTKYVQANSPLSLARMLQQVANGFMYYYEDNTSLTDKRYRQKMTKKIPYEKPEILKQIIKNDVKHKKFIVWSVFRESYKDIKKVLNELGINYLLGTGEASAKEKFELARKFHSDDRYQAIIANPSSVGEGIQFPRAQFSIYYNLDFNMVKFDQSKGRIRRRGSINFHNEIFYYYLLTAGTIEDRILDILNKKVEININFLKSITKGGGNDRNSNNICNHTLFDNSSSSSGR